VALLAAPAGALFAALRLGVLRRSFLAILRLAHGSLLESLDY
jgi:hypothetical protein